VLDGLTAVSEGAERLGRLPERFAGRLRIVLDGHADPPPPVAAAVSSRSAVVDSGAAHGLL